MTTNTPQDHIPQLPGFLRRLPAAGLIVGLIAAAIAVAGLLLSGPQVFYRAYLIAYLFWSSLTFGTLGLGLLHYLVGGNWGFLIQRPLEAGYKTLWLAALLFVPLLLGLPYLYPWAQPETVAASPLLQHKAPYLNPLFFIVRAVVYFAVPAVLARVLYSWAHQPAYFEDPLLRRRRQQVSAVGILVFGLLMSFAALDWIMSLEPEWYSTIFGMFIVTGQVLGGMALGIAVLPLLVREPPLADFALPGHIRDLGAMFLTMVVVWAYLAFSQYLILWYGNIPREVIWYLERFQGGWLWLELVVIAIQFVLPFVALLSLRAKRNLRLLAALAVGVLVMRWVDTYWLVAPAFSPGQFTFHWLDLVILVALGGFWAAAFAWHIQRTPAPLLPAARQEEGYDRGEQLPTA